MIDYETYEHYVKSLIVKYASKGIIIDTNILLAYLVGTYDLDFMCVWKRTKMYDCDDYEFIKKVLSQFSRRIVTAHILAELSNHSKGIKGQRSRGYFEVFREHFRNVDEKHIPKERILDCPSLPEFGVTDLGIVEAVKEFGYLPFIDEFAMANYFRRKLCVEVLNLNDLRTVKMGRIV